MITKFLDRLSGEAPVWLHSVTVVLMMIIGLIAACFIIIGLVCSLIA
jgi:hypothetical protein